jgi:hypothetical protein
VSTETRTETHLPHPVSAPPAGGPSIAPVQIPSPRQTGDGPLWERTSSHPLPGDQAPPRMRQLMGVCGWAAVLGGLGLVVGIRGFIGDLMGLAPGWYEPTMILIGLVGIGLTVGAFVTVRRRRMPYALLGGGTAVLILALVLTSAAF